MSNNGISETRVSDEIRDDGPEAARARRAAAFLPGDWFLEFQQDYGDGVLVTKRGLDASPLVVRKYEIGADEVLAFSTYDGKRRAMTGANPSTACRESRPKSSFATGCPGLFPRRSRC